MRTPRKSRLVLGCAGKGCPRHHWRRAARRAHKVARVHIHPFERRLLPAGVRLKITVTRHRFIGKYTLIKMRHRRPPSRRDGCLYPGSSRPHACP